MDDENPTRYHIVREFQARFGQHRWDEVCRTELRQRGIRERGKQGERFLSRFLHPDAKPLTPDWLTNLLAIAQRPEVGAVGAKLVSPGGSLHHSGLALGLLRGVGNPGRGLFESDYWRWLHYTRNVTAVSSACMVVRREVFESVNGFDESLTGDYRDADFCMRLRESGYEIILEQQATLVFSEKSALASADQEQRFQKKWGKRADPYFSKHLRTDREDTSLKIPS